MNTARAAQNLPRVKSHVHSDEGVALVLEIDPSLSIFEGHFDDTPIVAGVVQIDWAIAYSNIYFHKFNSVDIKCLEAVKFHNIIIPNTEINLDLSYKNNKLVFSYSSLEGQHSSGRIVIQ